MTITRALPIAVLGLCLGWNAAPADEAPKTFAASKRRFKSQLLTHLRTLKGLPELQEAARASMSELDAWLPKVEPERKRTTIELLAQHVTEVLAGRGTFRAKPATEGAMRRIYRDGLRKAFERELRMTSDATTKVNGQVWFGAYASALERMKRRLPDDPELRRFLLTSAQKAWQQRLPHLTFKPGSQCGLSYANNLRSAEGRFPVNNAPTREINRLYLDALRSAARELQERCVQAVKARGTKKTTD